MEKNFFLKIHVQLAEKTPHFKSGPGSSARYQREACDLHQMPVHRRLLD
jgi:hypothetical protein